MMKRPKVEGADLNNDIQALKVCLDELGDHAAAKGLPLAANLIGAASRAVADEILERKVQRQACNRHTAAATSA
jgi:hypothetical protein